MEDGMGKCTVGMVEDISLVAEAGNEGKDPIP